jgi:hypothetical protein
MNLRKWNRILHRDLGYIFFGMTIIYALSGIALNHLKEWNPNYIISRQQVKVALPGDRDAIDKKAALDILEGAGETAGYKKHYFPEANRLKIFIEGGSLEINTDSGEGVIEKIERRPIFYEINFLHYNPGKWWTWFSDIFAAALILIAITGLFIIKGNKGITGRGAWLTALGIALPLLFLFFL